MPRYIGVLVEELNPEVKKDGLDREQVRMDIDLKLPAAGIKMLSKEECSKNSEWLSQGEPCLFVYPRIMKTETELYVFRIDIEFRQIVRPKRYQDIESLDTVWNISCHGKTSDASDIRNVIKDGVDMFLDAYQSLNTKDEGKGGKQ